MNDKLTKQMDKGERDRKQAGADLAARTAAQNPVLKPEQFPSEGFAGRSMGWGVVEYSVGDKWRWWARFYSRPNPGTVTIETGAEDTWAEAVGAAKKAYHYMEENSDRPE